jgi:predicted extracellular nuclease
MLVEFDQILWVNNNYYLSNQGELELGVKRKPIPTNLAFPKTSEYTALVNENALAPVYLNNVSASVRMGERVDNLQGVLTYVSGKYILTPSQTPVVFYGNPRKREHDAIGNYNLKVCGFNLEYYLTSPNSSSMGPRTQAEMNRQHAKIVDALLAIDADVYGLVEIEQGQAALSKLVQALNTSTSSARYGYVVDNTSVSGTYTKAGYLYRAYD